MTPDANQPQWIAFPTIVAVIHFLSTVILYFTGAVQFRDCPWWQFWNPGSGGFGGVVYGGVFCCCLLCLTIEKSPRK